MIIFTALKPETEISALLRVLDYEIKKKVDDRQADRSSK